jgi:hypothetical protein
MAGLFELAPSARSRCRGCGEPLSKGDWRFGERLPNPFAEGEMTHWFHPVCAAYKRPEAILEALASAPENVPGREALQAAAGGSLARKRLARIDGAERAPSGQARCRHCHEAIERGTWRIRLVFHEEGTFNPSGFIHVGCRGPYFETDADILEHVLHFSRALEADERDALGRAFRES